MARVAFCVELAADDQTRVALQGKALCKAKSSSAGKLDKCFQTQWSACGHLFLLQKSGSCFVIAEVLMLRWPSIAPLHPFSAMIKKKAFCSDSISCWCSSRWDEAALLTLIKEVFRSLWQIGLSSEAAGSCSLMGQCSSFEPFSHYR